MYRTTEAQNNYSEKFSPLSTGIFQRKCTSCSNKTSAKDECTECANKKSKLQRKLSIGASNDPLEVEADRVADQVMNSSPNSSILSAAPRIQRASTSSGGADSSVPASVNRVLSGSGRSMKSDLRQDMEHRFSHDFSQVRVHTGADAEKSAGEVSARAYTVENNIVFGKGQFSPNTNTGKRLIAHELTHVVQQSGSNLSKNTLQRDLAIEPPNPDADGRVLTPAELQEAIDFNNSFLANIPNSAAIIEMIRDVFGDGINPTPAVVDADFVGGVIVWQAERNLTEDGKLGPRTARTLFREIGAGGTGRGRLVSGPTYSPGGTIAAVGGSTTFRLNAEFESDPANGIFPSCCEVRQYIRWNAAAAASFGGGSTVPHSGFPAAHPVDTWIEDRDRANKRYGRRSAPFTDPQSFDQYLDLSGARNQAFGHIYRGSDSPGGTGLAGQWQFLIRVDDVCNGGRMLGSDLIRINW